MRSFHFTVKAKLHIAGTAMGIGLRESDTPRPGPGQVLMRVRASALNFADLTFLSGRLPKAEGVIPLLDGAGEIVAIGAGVTAWNSILGGPLLKRPGVPGEAVLVQGTITCQRAKEYRGSHRRFEEPGSLCAR